MPTSSGWCVFLLMLSFSRIWGFSHGPRSLLRRSSQLAAKQTWTTGDRVLFDRDEEGILKGTVLERKGGWYTLSLEATKEVVKCRGTQLRPDADAQPVTPILAQASLKHKLEGDLAPPPTIYDLDAAVEALDPASVDHIEDEFDRRYLQQVMYHKSVDQWVVFTDLHCAPSSMDTTLQVLDTVHSLAVDRGAGVLFLGDWWHHRGTLRVDCLNAVLDHLKSWTVPMVMIPGNHDQVTLGGHNHGLTPLENSYRIQRDDLNIPGPLVFSHPTKFSNAMFIPHVRDHAVMESVLRSPETKASTAVFCHADVTGAYMNDLLVSTGGVPPDMFPSRKPIYSGHFHKPHVVEHDKISIEYLGSPYEVSLAEAGQAKSLAVLSAKDDWRCVERIPLDIGRKHFRFSSLDEFLGLSSGKVRPGDRVVLSIAREVLERHQREQGVDNELEKHAGVMRRLGVTVEIREEAAEVSEARAGFTETTYAEDLSMESTWQAFVKEEVRRERLTPEKGAELLAEGSSFLADFDSSVDEEAKGKSIHLVLESVEMEGFGPVKSLVHYPLLDRGLVLLRGTNRDGGSDRYVVRATCIVSTYHRD